MRNNNLFLLSNHNQNHILNQAEEEMQKQQYEMEKQQVEMQQRLAKEMEKFAGAAGPAFGGLMMPGGMGMPAATQAGGAVYTYGPNGELVQKF